ncbi:MAG: maltokinase [Actinomycetota bacterium]|jgi:maltokinase|nr:maltokinase [Actinomycetota bacterium]
MMKLDEGALHKILAEDLPSQRWFGARAVDAIERVTVLDDRSPALIQVIVRGDDGDRYQVVIGACDDDTIVDATADADLSLRLLRHVMPGEEVAKVRPLGAEQSNTSLVYDERLVLKIFRRLPQGTNPDAEVTCALAAIGFEHVIPPVAEWRDDDGDYGIVNELLVGASDGWHLALTSLRDLYDRRCPPEEAAGDFGFESERLGKVTAELHVEMAAAFGSGPADVDGWIADMVAQLARVDLPAQVARQARLAYEALRDVEPGPSFRVHGDYHLGQTLRTDAGWYVLDFEGEPARPVEERRRPSSPLRDVAGMMRSLHYATQVALRDFGSADDAELIALGAAWEEHNAVRFCSGYEGYGDIDRVLPPAEARAVVRRAFELDKATYEVGYETGHRPDWVGIPLSAITRLLETETET